MPCIRPCLSVLALLAAALPAGATEPPPAAASSAAERVVWHVVRPGDTLEALSERYLGDHDRWPENWKLNPQVANPHRLEPGERLRLKLSAGGGAPDAVLERKANAVDDKLGPRTWADATENDLLLDRDGVRTSERSSAALLFSDGARLLVTEDSLVFLRQQGKRLTAETPRGVEIQQGTADVRGLPAPSAALADVEIVLGAAHATSRLRRHSDGETRARKGSDGPSAFMVYRGEGAVEAAGTAVSLPQGTGSALPPSGPPSPPEALLPPPAVLEPSSGALLACAQPPVRWSAVDGAASYLVDLCHDAECLAPVEHAENLTATTWTPARLAPGDYVLRVRARSASGLDGYPTALPFRIGPGGGGSPLPAGVGIVATGVSGERAGTLWIDGRSQLALATPSGAVPQGLALTLDGKPADAAAWRGPWSPGTHTATASVPGACGDAVTVPAVRFAVDSEPPAARWEKVSLPPSGEQLAAREKEQRRRFPPPIRWPQPAQLEWSLDGQSWVPFSWGVPQPWQRGPRVPPAAWYSTLDEPENPGRLPQPVGEAVLYLRAPKANPFRAAAAIDLEGWQALAVHVTDSGSGVSRLYPRPVEVSRGDWVLRIEFADLVGNRKVLDWPIVAKSEK